MPRTVPAIRLARTVYPEYDSDRLGAFFACREVTVDGETVTDPQQRVSPDAVLEIITRGAYVSRGGYKLEHALKAFGFDVASKVVLDAGSSTGGFTDCLLRHGAAAVHSVDVGYNQLDWSLRSDPRVIVHERQNIMTLESLDPPARCAVADLSFRSISGAAGHILSLVSDRVMIALIKPQFEVPRGQAGFDGVIRDPELLCDVMMSVRRTLLDDGVGVEGLTVSPIRGRKGNLEFLALLRPGDGMSEDGYRSILGHLIGSQSDS